MPDQFLDTNVFLRHLRQDHQEMSPKATALLERIESGELRVRISDMVVFETVFTLERSYRLPRALIADALLPLLDLPGIVLPGKRQYRETFALYSARPMGFADCYHAVQMRRLGINEVISFDREFDAVPWLKRVEP